MVAALVSCCAPAQAQSIPRTVDALTAAYVRAFNAKDVSTLRSLLHPASIACITPESRYFCDEMLAVHIRDPIPATYHVEMKPVANNLELPGKGWAEFPVRPTQQIRLTFSRGPEESADLIVWAMRQGNRWYQVEPCLTATALQTLKADEPARKARVAEAQARVAAIQEPLRSELKALIRQGRTVTAEKRYQAATGSDLESAMLVIYHLTPEARQ
jgi:hypothetical protein